VKVIRNNKFQFKRGEKHHLDSIYSILGLFPEDSENPYYQQDDIGDLALYSVNTSKDGAPNDCGEYVKILRNFSVEIKIKG
jgi:hypothetical protein